jgi:hypothetical protein
MVDATRYPGEKIGSIGGADRRGLSDRVAGRLPERCERRRNGEYIFSFVGDTKRVGDEKGALGRDLDRAFGNRAEARGAFGQQVGIALGFPGDSNRPRTFQCACFSWPSRSIAAAKCLFKISAVCVRTFSNNVLWVVCMIEPRENA